MGLLFSVHFNCISGVAIFIAFSLHKWCCYFHCIFIAYVVLLFSVHFHCISGVAIFSALHSHTQNVGETSQICYYVINFNGTLVYHEAVGMHQTCSMRL